MKPGFIFWDTLILNALGHGGHKILIDLLNLLFTRKKIGVWYAISRKRIIGPIFFERTINSEECQNFTKICFRIN
jgi:hypothetical protein